MADGQAICPQCDYILDTSFLSDEPPERDDDEPTPAPKAPPRRERVHTSRTAKLRPSGAPGAARGRATRRPPPADEGSTRIKSMEEIEQERAKRGAARPAPRQRSSMPEAPARRLPTPPEEPAEDWRPKPVERRAEAELASSTGEHAPEQALADVKRWVGELSSADKLAFVGAVGNVLVSFFPWKETARDGEVLGAMSLGIAVTLASVLAIAAIALRASGAFSRSPMLTWALQLGAMGFSAVWCLVYVKLSWDGRMVPAIVGNLEVRASAPAMGVYLAILCSLVGLGGTLLGMKERR